MSLENDSKHLEMKMALSTALAGLPPKQRLIFVLKEIEGYKYSEIGEILSIPEGTVKSIMHRAIRILRKDLWGYNPKKTYQMCKSEIHSLQNNSQRTSFREHLESIPVHMKVVFVSLLVVMVVWIFFIDNIQCAKRVGECTPFRYQKNMHSALTAEKNLSKLKGIKISY